MQYAIPHFTQIETYVNDFKGVNSFKRNCMHVKGTCRVFWVGSTHSDLVYNLQLQINSSHDDFEKRNKQTKPHT